MKKYIQNQKGKYSFKKYHNKKKFTKRNNSIELYENYNDILSKEKNKHNLSEISSYKQIKKIIKNISAPTKTFYSRNFLHQNNYNYFPINISSNQKTKKYLDSMNKLNYNPKLNQAKTISEKSKEKTIYNNSNTNNKIRDYSIYLPDEFKGLTFYQKFDLNLPKSKDFFNTKIGNIKSFNNNSKFSLSGNNIKLKLKLNSEANSLITNYYKNISEYNKKYINIYNPKKILHSNININIKKKKEVPPEISKEIESKDMKITQFNSLGLSKRQLQNKLYQKIKEKEKLTIEKDELIKNGNKIKENILENNISMEELNTNSNIIIPKKINNNNSTILERKDSLKVYNIYDSNKIIQKINLFKTPKIKKINEELPKITNYNCDDSPRSQIDDLTNEKKQTFNSIKNGGIIINKKVNYSSNIINFYGDKKEEIKDEFIKNKNKFMTSKKVQKELFINEYNKKNKNFLNIIPIKRNKITEKNNLLLHKIMKRNKNENKYLLLNKKAKKYKKSILTNQINNIKKLISNKNTINFTYESNNQQEFGNKYLEIYEGTNKKYEKIYSEVKQTSILNILLYLYFQFLNKCVLNENIINYLLLNNSFSSIYVPLVDFSKKRCPLFLSDKLFIIKKNITIFEDKKSKFIESKKSKQIFHNISLNFINKELFYFHLNSKNIPNYWDKKCLMYLSPKKERKINSCNKKSSPYKINSKSIGKKSNKKSTFFNDNTSINMNKKLQKLSVLQNKNIFKMTEKNRDINGKLKTKKKRGVIVNQENKYHRLLSRQSNAYYELIRYINEKHNVALTLKKLIKEGEVLLFLEHLNNSKRKIDINNQDEDGNTFLILSIKYNLNKLSKILLEKGIDINIQNKDGNSALHYALSGKNFYMADILRKYGANEDSINKLGYTPWDSIGKNIEIDTIC